MKFFTGDSTGLWKLADLKKKAVEFTEGLGRQDRARALTSSAWTGHCGYATTTNPTSRFRRLFRHSRQMEMLQSNRSMQSGPALLVPGLGTNIVAKEWDLLFWGFVSCSSTCNIGHGARRFIRGKLILRWY
eukprot:GHVT01017466.1.p1 GENE.GHVT01017466.1~~GHVT01017466.1.p1  ORF type:complete len:131 (-),score=4.54 GHVT01017466.1:37-429(-)